MLRTHELGEADLIVSLFARNEGRLRGVARSARKSRRRFAGALEPLTLVRVEWAEKSGRELHRIDALEVRRSFAAMQSDPMHQAACALFAELTEQFAAESQPDPPAYRLLGAVLEALEQGADPWTLVRYFMYWTLRLHGLLPDLDRCASCERELSASRGRWVGESGDPLCSECAVAAGAIRLEPRELDFLRQVSTAAPAALTRGEATRHAALDRLLRRQLERFTERSLRSWRHLRAYGGGA